MCVWCIVCVMFVRHITGHWFNTCVCYMYIFLHFRSIYDNLRSGNDFTFWEQRFLRASSCPCFNTAVIWQVRCTHLTKENTEFTNHVITHPKFNKLHANLHKNIHMLVTYYYYKIQLHTPNGKNNIISKLLRQLHKHLHQGKLKTNSGKHPTIDCSLKAI